MDKLKKLVTRPKKEEKEEDKKDLTNELLSPQSCGFRVKVAAMCFIIGVCCSVLGTCTLYIPGLGVGVFALLFSVGNLCSLISVTLLIGPMNQLKSMCAKERALASIILLLCMGLTLLFALQFHNSILALIFCIIQLLAFIWYILSYVPYARTGVSKLCAAVCC